VRQILSGNLGMKRFQQRWPQWSSSQGALCWALSGPKIAYWKGTTTLFPWFSPKWLLAVSWSKVCLKGMKISGYWRH